jgi:hypothetical protein
MPCPRCGRAVNLKFQIPQHSTLEGVLCAPGAIPVRDPQEDPALVEIKLRKKIAKLQDQLRHAEIELSGYRASAVLPLGPSAALDCLIQVNDTIYEVPDIQY